MFSWRQNSTALAVSASTTSSKETRGCAPVSQTPPGGSPGPRSRAHISRLAVDEGLEAAAQLVEPVGRDALADDEVAVV